MVERVRLPEEPQKDGRGGKREGAGRKVGSTSEKSIVAKAHAMANGHIAPHELLCEWVNKGVIPPKDEKDKPQPLTVDQMIKAASAAAPYYQPKLVATHVINESANHGPITIDNVKEHLIARLCSFVERLHRGDQSTIEARRIEYTRD